MFCTKCGNQLDDKDLFCSRCGNPRAGSVKTFPKSQPNYQHPYSPVARPSIQPSVYKAPISNQLKVDLNAVKQKDIGSIIQLIKVCTLILQPLAFLFWFIGRITLNTSIYGASASVSFSFMTMFEETEMKSAGVFSVIFLILAIAITVLILINPVKSINPNIYRISLIITDLISIIILFTLTSTASSLANEEYQGLASVGLSFCGILFMITELLIIGGQIYTLIKSSMKY